MSADGDMPMDGGAAPAVGAGGGAGAAGVAVPLFRGVPRLITAWPPQPRAAACRWDWQDEDGWVPYAQAYSEFIEAAFVKNEASTTFEVNGTTYEIKFDTLCQVNQSTAYSRRIRRVRDDVVSAPVALAHVISSAENPYKDMLSTVEQIGRLTSWAAVPDGTQDVKCVVCHEIDSDDSNPMKRFTCCSTYMHADTECALQYFRHSTECPGCRRNFLPAIGTQPPGTADFVYIPVGHDPLDGFFGFATIQIDYIIPEFVNESGLSISGTRRIAYVPDTPQGRVVCELLAQAFKRRLTFMVGRSITDNLDNATVWSGRIHHRTCQRGGPASFGYPDDTYLDRTLAELYDNMPDLRPAAGQLDEL